MVPEDGEEEQFLIETRSSGSLVEDENELDVELCYYGQASAGDEVKVTVEAAENIAHRSGEDNLGEITLTVGQVNLGERFEVTVDDLQGARDEDGREGAIHVDINGEIAGASDEVEGIHHDDRDCLRQEYEDVKTGGADASQMPSRSVLESEAKPVACATGARSEWEPRDGHSYYWEQADGELQSFCDQAHGAGWVGNVYSVTCNYRSPALNKNVGGVGNSQHLFGLAADMGYWHRDDSDDPMFYSHLAEEILEDDWEGTEGQVGEALLQLMEKEAGAGYAYINDDKGYVHADWR